MPITVEETRFYSQLINGEDFSQNLMDSSTNPIRGVGRLAKTLQKVHVSWTAEADGVNSFDIIGGNTLERQAGSFLDDQFAINDIVRLYDDPTGANTDIFGSDRKILSISDSTIVFDGAVVAPGSYVDAKLYGKTPLEAARFRYGLIENNEPTNFVSKIDGTAEHAFTASNVVTAGSAVTMVPQMIESARDDGNVTIEYISTLSQTFDFAQVFTIEHVFRVFPIYLEGEKTNLQNKVPPTLFASTNRLKYVYQLDFSDLLSNSTTKTVLVDGNLGQIKWFEEAPNGFQNTYNIGSVSYEDVITTDPKSAIDSQNQTQVTFTVNNPNNIFTAATPFVVLISYLPPESEYQQNSKTIAENFLLESVYQVTGDPAKSGTIISDLEATINSPSEIEVTFNTNYTTAQSLTIGNGDYLISIQIANPNNLFTSETDEVPLIVDCNTYLFDGDTEGLTFFSPPEFYPHDVDDTDDGFANYAGWIGDVFMKKQKFRLNIDEFINVVEIKESLSAYNAATGARFDIQSFSFDVSNIINIVDSGMSTPYINIGGNRGYLLDAQSQFNNADIKIGAVATEGSINVREYEMKIGMKVNFEENIPQSDADPIFIDPSQQNNGLNKKTSNYSDSNGYTVRSILDIIVEEPDGKRTTYTNISVAHDIRDYSEDGNSPADWVNTVELKDSSGNIVFDVLTNDITSVKVTCTPDSGTTNLNNPWGVIRLIQEGGNVNNEYELSTFRDSIPNNPLIPLAGESYVKLTDTGAVVELECRIDPTLLPTTSGNYCITGRHSDENIAIGGKLTEGGEFKQTEDGVDIKITEQ